MDLCILVINCVGVRFAHDDDVLDCMYLVLPCNGAATSIY